ncbi:hypothetical protein [Nonomuraea ceibae]|uniref:hypothetical protein n=1 Tax=Nonomuraea ceibae TaxID=1935170 RepID=UPI001C5F92A1|nr:hypothetical protein [Nonomuraea ceibae]
MKLVVAALLAGAFLATPAQAAGAAPADPVAALKSRSGAGKGVRFTEVASYVELAGKSELLTRRGAFQYGKSGFAASDISVKHTEKERVHTFLDDERVITVGKVSYVRNKLLGEGLPKGKTWTKTHRPLPAGLTAFYTQPVNAAEPEALKALIKGAKRSGRTYTGSITFEQLAKASPWARSVLVGEQDDEVIRYTLTVGADRLPRQLRTTYLATAHGFGGNSTSPGDEVSTRTVYEGWGHRQTIKAPPASQVYTGKE